MGVLFELANHNIRMCNVILDSVLWLANLNYASQRFRTPISTANIFMISHAVASYPHSNPNPILIPYGSKTLHFTSSSRPHPSCHFTTGRVVFGYNVILLQICYCHPILHPSNRWVCTIRKKMLSLFHVLITFNGVTTYSRIQIPASETVARLSHFWYNFVVIIMSGRSCRFGCGKCDCGKTAMAPLQKSIFALLMSRSFHGDFDRENSRKLLQIKFPFRNRFWIFEI